MTSDRPDITELLVAWEQGDEAALGRLTPLVHDELRRIARRHMSRERSGHTLQATALVNEAYLRLAGLQHVTWENRAHLLAMASHLMRHILVDIARSKRYEKRGGGAARVTFDEALMGSPARTIDLVVLNDALESLARVDERKSRVIEMRFFGGLSVEETAAALSVSRDTVLRDWRLARAWLKREMRSV